MTRFTLNQILAADAITSGTVFLLGVFATGPVAALLGLPGLLVFIAGWICAAVGALMAGLALQVRPNRALVMLVVIGNLGWVAASFGVMAVYFGQLTPLGLAVVPVQALAVLGFAWAEARGSSPSATAVA